MLQFTKLSWNVSSIENLSKRIWQLENLRVLLIHATKLCYGLPEIRENWQNFSFFKKASVSSNLQASDDADDLKSNRNVETVCCPDSDSIKLAVLDLHLLSQSLQRW